MFRTSTRTHTHTHTQDGRLDTHGCHHHTAAAQAGSVKPCPRGRSACLSADTRDQSAVNSELDTQQDCSSSSSSKMDAPAPTDLRLPRRIDRLMRPLCFLFQSARKWNGGVSATCGPDQSHLTGLSRHLPCMSAASTCRQMSQPSAADRHQAHSTASNVLHISPPTSCLRNKLLSLLQEYKTRRPAFADGTARRQGRVVEVNVA